jgi:hypothetical protein
MEAKIPAKSILLFSKMITCLSKIGEDLFLEATESKVLTLLVKKVTISLSYEPSINRGVPSFAFRWANIFSNPTGS